MADDFDISKYLQGISIGAPDSSFDSDGFNTDLFGSSSGSGFNDEGFNIDFLNDLTSGNISSSDNFDSSGFNTSYMDRLLGNDKKSSAFDAENLFAALTGAASSSSKKDEKNLLQRAASKIFGPKGDKSPGTLEMLALLAGTSLMKDRGMMNPDVPNVGYQGGIPEYQAIQEVVRGRDDSGRRPGSGGRRYMSDVIYAKAPENQEPMSVAEAQAKAKAQAQGFAEGGYLNGNSDGQADEVPGSIDGVQEARLSHGEYVLPADVVSLLGNGNSDAGAKALDEFMAMVRKKGTGTEKQQKNIDAVKVLETLIKKPKRAPRANKALARKMGKG